MTWLAPPAPGAGEEVHVDVVDDLPALWPAMHSEPVAALGEALRLAQRSGRKEAAAQHFDVASLHRHDRWDVAPRNDQEVDGRFGVDVSERDDRVVLVLDVGRSLAVDDAAEHAVGHGASSRRCYNTRLSSCSDSRRSSRWERVRSASAGSGRTATTDRKSTRLNSSHSQISYAVFCLKKKNK